jgi:hypothetical protein
LEHIPLDSMLAIGLKKSFKDLKLLQRQQRHQPPRLWIANVCQFLFDPLSRTWSLAKAAPEELASIERSRTGHSHGCLH